MCNCTYSTPKTSRQRQWQKIPNKSLDIFPLQEIQSPTGGECEGGCEKGSAEVEVGSWAFGKEEIPELSDCCCCGMLWLESAERCIWCLAASYALRRRTCIFTTPRSSSERRKAGRAFDAFAPSGKTKP